MTSDSFNFIEGEIARTENAQYFISHGSYKRNRKRDRERGKMGLNPDGPVAFR